MYLEIVSIWGLCRAHKKRVLQFQLATYDCRVRRTSEWWIVKESERPNQGSQLQRKPVRWAGEQRRPTLYNTSVSVWSIKGLVLLHNSWRSAAVCDVMSAAEWMKLVACSFLRRKILLMTSRDRRAEKFITGITVYSREMTIRASGLY